ncbi:MAG: YdiY family protein [Gammaproteobacteria bacterium]
MNGLTNSRLVRIGATSIILMAGAFAQAQDEEDKGPWSGKAGLGYLQASGNADNLTVNASVDLAYNWEQWTHSLAALAIGASANDVSSAERYTLDLKTQRDFSEFDYLYGLIAYQKDRFAGVAEQLSETVGYGRRLINTDVHVLNVEAGVGFRQLTFADTIDENGLFVRGEDESSAIVRLGGDYLWNFSDTANFTQSLAILAGSDNTSTESISAVTAKLLGAMDLVVSFTVNHNTDAPVGTTSTDRFTAISLQYAW